MAVETDPPVVVARRSRKRPRRRLRELERDAARRSLNGNGMNGSLPPLPVSNDGDDGDDDDGDGGGDFGTLFGHPYGALPYGNIHLASPPAADSAPKEVNEEGIARKAAPKPWHPDIVRHQGLGPMLRVLNDEQLLSVLSFVDGPTLAGGIVASSRFLYAAGHHEELWRDLVLRRWGEDGFTVPSPDTRLGDDTDDADAPGEVEDGTSEKQNATGCWKDIHAYNHYNERISQNEALAEGSPQKPKPLLIHSPIAISGIYSDTFFRSFLCRSFALQPSWLSTHTVPILSHDEVTTAKFVKEYEEENKPLLIKGASKSWPALQGNRKWDSDYLLKVTEGKTFRATSGVAPLPAQFNLTDYFNYCASSTEEAPLYLFDRTFASKCPQLLKDFDAPMKSSCPWWCRDNEEAGHDLFSVLGEERRPDYQWLIVGPKRSGSCFHIDPNCTHAWNAPIVGRKRWIFYPPGVTPPGVFPSPCGDDVCMPISIGEWFLTFWDAHVERRNDPDVMRRPMECTACPGDVLFVPHGWWHMVLNIGDDDAGVEDARGVSVALTRNYVSASNLSDVLRFLDTRVSQISGCRDRGGAVRPEELGQEFRKGLLSVIEEKDDANAVTVDSVSRDNGEEKKCNESHDCNGSDENRGKWTNILQKAEKSAKEGWGCDAWVDLPSSPSCAATNLPNEEQQKSSGSSILARAKKTTCAATMDISTNASDPVGAATSSSSSGGFSFSFL